VNITIIFFYRLNIQFSGFLGTQLKCGSDLHKALWQCKRLISLEIIEPYIVDLRLAGKLL